MKKLAIIITLIFLSSAFAAAGCPCQNAAKSNPGEENDYIQLASQINEINYSLQAAFAQEKRLRNRTFFHRLFFGGDWGIARPLENETGRNIKTLEALQGKVRNCTSCTGENKALLESKIRKMQKEQERIHVFSIVQSRLRGLFGWFKR